MTIQTGGCDLEDDGGVDDCDRVSDSGEGICSVGVGVDVGDVAVSSSDTGDDASSDVKLSLSARTGSHSELAADD